jgi:hypothetical protein
VAFKANDWSKPSRDEYIHNVEAACENAGNTLGAARNIRNLQPPAGHNVEIRAVVRDLDRINADWPNWQAAQRSGNTALAS